MNDESYIMFGETQNLEARAIMDGEENKIMNCSNKRIKVIEANSDEDEPLGSLFNLKKKKKNNEPKPKPKPKPRAHKPTSPDDEILGEMDDTLAIFWKKLKAPKTGKDSESGTTKGKPSAKLFETPTCTASAGDDDDDHALLLPRKPKAKPKKSPLLDFPKKPRKRSQLGDLNQNSGVRRSQNQMKKKLKEEVPPVGDTCSQSSDDNLDFSLSAFLRKSQSGLAKRARSSTTQKKKNKTQSYVDQFSQIPHVALQCVSPQLIHGSCSASVVSGVSLKTQLGLDLAPGQIAKDPIILEQAQEAQRLISSCVQGGMVLEPDQELASSPKVTAGVISSNSDQCSISTQGVFRDSIHIPPLPRCESASVTDFRVKVLTPNISESNTFTDIMIDHKLNPENLHQSCGAASEHIPPQHIQLDSYQPDEKPMGETKGSINASMYCSKAKEAELLDNDGEGTGNFSDNAFSPVVQAFGEISGASNRPSKGNFSTTDCYLNAARERSESGLMPREETLVTSATDDTLNRLSDVKCDDYNSKLRICSNQPSAADFVESCSKKSPSSPSNIETLVTSTFNQPAQPSGETAENPLLHSLQTSSSLCALTRTEEKLTQYQHGSVKPPDLQPSPCAPFPSALGFQKDEIGGDHDGSYAMQIDNTGEGLTSPVSNDGLYSAIAPPVGIKQGDCYSHDIHKKNLRTTVDVSVTNNFSDSFTPVYFDYPQNEEYSVASIGSPAPNQDCPPFGMNANAICSQPIKLEPNGISQEEAGTESDLENKEKKHQAIQRAARKVKKRRHGDMAYEGDIHWDFLMHAQGPHGNKDVSHGERTSRETDRSNCSDIVVEAENCDTAAVAAGLKARAACPFEKIKFKEILKRRGGLQEYLECRNSILSLWSKDTSRVLHLSDCGITDAPSSSDPPRASLIREIFNFLDHNGYINVGIASEKEKTEPYADVQQKIFKEEEAEGSSAAQVADSEDGVPSMLCQVRYPERLHELKIDMLSNSEMPQATRSMGSESCLIRSAELLIADEQKSGVMDAKLSNRISDIDSLSNFSSEVVEGGPDVGVAPEKIVDSDGIQPTVVDPVEVFDNKQCNSIFHKKIIVIGAGPAGLTAARHLQRQGFSVTILEARNRLGGRVYTDHSSLSVPVDLGASIITGVEADVATERRPDPSSLVCSQLGLELTVLNSDCPLYDIVTGQKVPPELDEALEAEYNSLLDDMVVLVEQNGERAMKMSLEDGLEYALKKRRMTQSKPYVEELELDTAVNCSLDTRVDGEKKACTQTGSEKETLSPLERRVMNWHFANLEYGCAALLKSVSLPNWNQDDLYGGFGGAHCMIKGGYSNVIESLGKGLHIQLNHTVTEISYSVTDYSEKNGLNCKVKVSTSNGTEFLGDAVLITVPLGCLKANAIKFSPSLPQWKQSSIHRLGFGVLNKVVLEFPNVFWDDTVDYFGATAEETDRRGQCFMFWNVKKTVGAPVLIALVVGKAALDGESMSSADHVDHALKVLRKLFSTASVPDPVASVVTNWGQDPFSRGAYSYVAVGASGEDYDILGRPVENCLFFAGEATCKEHPDTVGGAMMSGLREAVRIIDILSTGKDYTAEVEAMEAAQRQTESERNEVRDIMNRLEAVTLSSSVYKSSLDGGHMLTKEAVLQDMFRNTKTTKGRLHLVKELLNLQVDALKSFAGTREGLSTLNSWILDSMGKDGTQLLRHCVRLLVLVSTNLLAVRLSGIGKTVKEKVCVHTSRDIRAVASQLVNVWIEVFRKEKAANGGLKLLRQTTVPESSKNKSSKISVSGKCIRTAFNRGHLQDLSSPGKISPPEITNKKTSSKSIRLDSTSELKSEGNSFQDHDPKAEEDDVVISEEEAAVFAAAEAARAAARAAAEAYASSEAERNALRDLPKIPSFHKFARREQYVQMDDTDFRKRWSGGVLGRQDCLSEIDSRNCKVQNWTVDFSAACGNLDTSRISGDNYSQKSQSNEVEHQFNLREHSGESAATDSRFTKAWVDSAGSGGVKDYQDIERWQSQAAAVDPEFFHHRVHIRDEEDSNIASKPLSKHYYKGTEGSAASQAAENFVENQTRGVERIKKAVVDYVGSLLMPLYKARKIDRDGYKSIMKKSATKVMEQTTDAEKGMSASEFLDFKRKNKIRAFVDKLIEKHMSSNSVKS